MTKIISECTIKPEIERVMEIVTSNANAPLGIGATIEEFSLSEEGRMYWIASWYAKVLGYKSMRTFKPVIVKARENCTLLGISAEENFKKFDVSEITDHKKSYKSKSRWDYKLTKFACFLIAMQADRRKPRVRKAQLYFLHLMEELNTLMTGQKFLQRRASRENIRELNISLTRAAARANVEDYRYFINEGFVGMYNKSTGLLKSKRGIPSDSNFYDHLGMTELSANIFRIALTTERLKQMRKPTEKKAALEHKRIGAQIRKLIQQYANVNPEFLPTKINLKRLSRTLKMAARELNEETSSLIKGDAQMLLSDRAD